MTTRFYAHWRDVPLETWRWPSFSPAETACRGSGAIRIHEEALDRLQALLALAAGLCALLIWLSLRALSRIARAFGGFTRLALLRLVRKPLLALLQGSALAVALTALLLAARVGPDLLAQWQGSLPANTPNCARRE